MFHFISRVSAAPDRLDSIDDTLERVKAQFNEQTTATKLVDTRLLDVMRQTNERLVDIVQQMNDQIREIKANLPSLIDTRVLDQVKNVATQRMEKLNGNTPYFEIVAERDLNDEGQMAIEFDWNDAFIDKLRKNKYPGTTDKEVVASWIHSLGRYADTALSGDVDE